MDEKPQPDALPKRLETLGKLIDGSPAVLFLWRIEPNDWPVDVVSANVQNLLGYTSEDFTSGRVSWPEITHPDDVPRLEQEVQKLFSSGRDSWSQQYRLITQDKRIIWAEDWNRVLHDEDGNATHIQALVIDITARRNAEEALRQSEERYRTLFESSRDAIVTLEPPSWRFTSGNPATVCMFRAADEAELTAREPWQLSPHRQPDGRLSSEKSLEMIETAMREGSHFFEWTHARINGETFFASVLLTRVVSGGGTFLQATIRDITAQKRVEREHSERTRQLAQLTSELTASEQRERRRLAELLHDDLQQLLVAARIGVHSLAKNAREQNRRALDRLSETLGEALASASAITKDLAPPVSMHKDLPAAIRWLESEMSARHDLAIDVRIDDVTGPMNEAVTVLLFTAARELLLNVIKHTECDRAELSLTRKSGSIVLVVRDDGKGTRTEPALDRKSRRGFGLFSISERAELLGGKLTLETEPQCGTRVTLSLPAPVEINAPPTPSGDRAHADGQQPRDAGGERDPRPSDQPIRVVFADDHHTVREGLVSLIRPDDGIAVVGEAENGIQAVECAERLRPDVMVMDVSMPIMDGVEATRVITAQWPGIRIIGLSMYDDTGVARQMREAGAAEYFTKSSPPEKLIAAIQACGARETKIRSRK